MKTDWTPFKKNKKLGAEIWFELKANLNTKNLNTNLEHSSNCVCLPGHN